MLVAHQVFVYISRTGHIDVPTDLQWKARSSPFEDYSSNITPSRQYFNPRDSIKFCLGVDLHFGVVEERSLIYSPLELRVSVYSALGAELRELIITSLVISPPLYPPWMFSRNQYLQQRLD